MYSRSLEAENNAYFESCLAICLTQHSPLFTVVTKLSDAILKILSDAEKKQKIIKQLAVDENFKNLKNELYIVTDSEKKYVKGAFGSLNPNKSIDEITPQEALNDIESALQKKNNLVEIMPLHSVFGYRILRLLDPDAYNKAVSLFSTFKKSHEETKKKSVIKKFEDKDIQPTDQLGIASTVDNFHKINAMTETKKLSSEIITAHRNSLQRFSINNDSGALQNFINDHAPLAAGPSTHALSLFTAAYAYKNNISIEFTTDELLEYALAYFVYLTIAGYHSFHEVMFVAATSLNLSYNMDSYLANIPKANEKLYDQCKAIMERFASENRLYNSQGFFSSLESSIDQKNNELAASIDDDNQKIIQKLT